MRYNKIHGPGGVDIAVTENNVRIDSLDIPIVHVGVNTTYGLDTGVTYTSGNLYYVNGKKFNRCGDIIQGEGKMYTHLGSSLYGTDGKIWYNVFTDIDVMACLISDNK